MNSLICVKPGLLEYEEIPAPPLTAGHAILKIKRIGICGTDLHAFEGTQPFFDYPRILGHELAADLIEADGAPFFKPGEAVSFIPYFHCSACNACRMGKPNCCVHLKVFGVHLNGGMADYVSVPSSTLLKAEGLGYEELAMVEPFSIGAHAIRRAGVRHEEFVLISGAGPIGLATLEFARIAGARIIVSDINEDRLKFCKEKLRIDHVLNGRSENLKEQLAEITHGDMPDVVIDATGNREAIQNSFQYLAHGGRLVLVGLQKEEIRFSHPEFHRREATLMSSRNATVEDFQFVIDCMKKDLIKPSIYITHRVSFAKVKAEFDHWLHPSTALIKVMVDMD